MNPVAVLAVLGVLCGAGGLLWSLRPHRAPQGPGGPAGFGPGAGRRIGAAALAGVAALLLTRWPVAGLGAATAVAALPSVLRTGSSPGSLATIEAVATWTEMLRDTLAASAGLAQALVTTAPVAPPAIREPVGRLGDRLVNGVALDEALRALAVELADPSADVVVSALLLAATARAQRLGDLLGALAEAVREDVAVRLRIEAGRASARSGVKTIVVFSLAFAGALLVLARSYLAPFGTVTGQVVLAGVVACYAAGVALMLRMVRPRAGVRLLAPAGSR